MLSHICNVSVMVLIASSLPATTAYAQFPEPSGNIHGVGSGSNFSITSAADCYGIKTRSQLGISDIDYNTSGADTPTTRFNCLEGVIGLIRSPNFGAPRAIRPDLQIFYGNFGSGTGRASWLQGRVSASLDTAFSFFGRGPLTSDEGYQFSISETALTTEEIAQYNSQLINPFNRYARSDTANNLFGAPIQVPLALIPIAIAFSPVYAKQVVNGIVVEYKFKLPVVGANGLRGLRLTKQQYCGILNGTLSNWNQLPRTVVDKDRDGVVNSPVETDQTPFNVPIILAAPSNTQSSTSIITRALSIQCNGLSVNTGVGGIGPLTPIVNRYTSENSRLPYDGSRLIAGTAYSTGSNSTSNVISGAFFDKINRVISGTETPARFTIANGDDGVTDLLAYHPAPDLRVNGGRTLNGRLGYVGAGHALPAVLVTGLNNYSLNVARLNNYLPDQTGVYVALSSIRPPQTGTSSGGYSTNTATSGVYGDRANPLDWVPKFPLSSGVVRGYPLIGTVNALLYTCYATSRRRETINNFFTLFFDAPFGAVDSQLQAFPTRLITDRNAGILVKLGLIPMSDAWKNAVTQTFFIESTERATFSAPTTLGSRQLWIQNAYSDIAQQRSFSGNPGCQLKPGA